MTLNEITYNILNLLRGGRSNHNEHISLRQIEFNVHHYRALLLRRDHQRNGFISRHVEQDLHCVELERADGSKCCGLPLGCEVSRSKLKLPRTIRFTNREAMTVSDVTGLCTIPVINPIHVQLLPFDRFTKNDRKAYMIEDHLYIYNPDGIDTVNIRGVFEDPTDLGRFRCNDGNCYDPNMEYPMPADLIEALTSGILSGAFQLIPMTSSDTLNDAAQEGGAQRMKARKDGEREDSRDQ